MKTLKGFAGCASQKLHPCNAHNAHTGEASTARQGELLGRLSQQDVDMLSFSSACNAHT
jgi:hypothetical protein